MSVKKGRARHCLQIFFDTFLVRNIVLVKMVGICPIIAAATNLKNAVTLTVCAAVSLLPTALLMSLVGDKLKPVVRAPLYTLLASLILVGVAWIVNDYVEAELYATLYLYLPLMAVNTLMTYRAGGFAVAARPPEALADAFGSSMGFGLVICTVAVVREFLAYGTVWDVPLVSTPWWPTASSPFAAFFLLAVLAALLQFTREMLRRFVEGEVTADV